MLLLLLLGVGELRRRRGGGLLLLVGLVRAVRGGSSGGRGGRGRLLVLEEVGETLGSGLLLLLGGWGGCGLLDGGRRGGDRDGFRGGGSGRGGRLLVRGLLRAVEHPDKGTSTFCQSE